MSEITVRAGVEIAHSDRLRATVFRHSVSKFEIRHEAETYRFQLNRFMVHAPDIYFRPIDRFALDRATQTVIDTDMVRARTEPAVTGFGDPGPLGEDGRRPLTFTDNGLAIDGPVLCVSPWGGAFSNQILHILMGITQCDDILGDRLPVLVPDDLSAREKSNLAFAGIDESRWIGVPRTTACRVKDAFIPSKSFIRNSTFGPKKFQVNYGFLFEPTTLLAYTARIRANPRIAKPPTGGPRRVVYISRKDAGGRYTTNEDEAVQALSQFDLRYIMPTQVPIEEIAQAIANADVVISAFGSAILHFLAARHGTTLIEFDHPASDQCGRAICRVTGCEHVYCTRVTEKQRSFLDVSDNPVDVKELVGLVEAALTRHDEKARREAT
jgi:hypothetical protein